MLGGLEFYPLKLSLGLGIRTSLVGSTLLSGFLGSQFFLHGLIFILAADVLQPLKHQLREVFDFCPDRMYSSFSVAVSAGNLYFVE